MFTIDWVITAAIISGIGVTLLLLLPWLLGVRYIPHHKVGIIEKLWSAQGSLEDGQIVALDGKAGFQAEMLRGGIHLGYFPWQYRIHPEPLIVVSEGKLGYVYARDGIPLPPTQTLGRNVECNSFQNGKAFLGQGGQRSRQRRSIGATVQHVQHQPVGAKLPQLHQRLGAGGGKGQVEAAREELLIDFAQVRIVFDEKDAPARGEARHRANIPIGAAAPR